ncbi:hypothetical protein [Lacihabitans sp. LS3-19]|uniref:hypothetical protein n=1 Tax=Lacihabitans sp. LS3-19 TaxID=2487335 RepID=UPI0020CFE69E|nr:hypothetical protein [Lacihabitans sp. LS3-19]
MKKHFKILALFTGLVVLASCEKMDDTDMTPGMQTSTTAVLYASNNSNGDISAYDLKNSGSSATTFTSSASAADGVYFDANSNTVFQVSRTDKNIEGFKLGANISLGGILNLDVSLKSSNDMESPREMAVNGDYFVVVDNADVDKNAATLDGRLFVYQKTGDSFKLRNVITTDFKLWGITFIGNDLYAVVDADNELAVFSNFLNNMSNASLSASKRVVIEGIVRTHGLDYDESTDTMVLTDIGDATNTQTDGGFQVITGFKSKFNGVSNNGTLTMSNQIRVAGAMSLMGNPVDVAYDGETKTVYIAEAGNGGGRVLSYTNIMSSGDMSPVMNTSLAAASALYLHKK